MQSDTYLPDTDSEDDEYASDSSGDLPKTNNIGVKYDFPTREIEGQRFLDQSVQSKYLQLRNELFTPQIETMRIVLYSHHAPDGDVFKSSFDLVDQLKLGNVKNVIGFELITAEIQNVRHSVTGEIHTYPYMDLVIPEIPHKACKQTEMGIPIISRLKTAPLTDLDTFYLNEPQRSYTNYFTPIQLSTLTIKLFDKKGGEITDNLPTIMFEFEISVLKDSLSKR